MPLQFHTKVLEKRVWVNDYKSHPSYNWPGEYPLYLHYEDNRMQKASRANLQMQALKRVVRHLKSRIAAHRILQNVEAYC